MADYEPVRVRRLDLDGLRELVFAPYRGHAFRGHGVTTYPLVPKAYREEGYRILLEMMNGYLKYNGIAGRSYQDLDIEVHDVTVGPSNACSLFGGCDVVCECFDRPEAKAMLVESILSGTDVPVVSCSGMAGFGSSNSIVTERRMSRLYVCGDGESDSSDGPGLTAARVMVCAGHAANMTLRLILGHDKP